MVDKWLHDRQDLIVCYSELAQQAKADTPVNSKQVQKLCNIMVDYTSAGHFEIFEQLCREAEAFSDQKAIELSQKILPLIQVSTDVILDFNETCDSSGDLEKALPAELSNLGEHLADRFQHEDILIETLHTAHQELADS